MATPRDSAVERISRQCLGFRLRALGRVITGVYDAALRPHGVRVSQFNILVAIASKGPVRAVDLCQHLMLERSTVSRDLERLIARNWVSSTPGHGRAIFLEITEEGHQLLEAATVDWEKAQRESEEICGPEFTSRLFQIVQDLSAIGGDAAATNSDLT